MTHGSPMDTFEVAAVCATLALFAGYHLHLYIVRPTFLGESIPFAVNMVNAEMWIKKHREASDPTTTVLAVQTLRNTLMAAIFIGGNSIVIAYDLANDYPDLMSQRLKVRSLIIMGLMFSSFLCWANVIRLASVLGYMIGTMQYSEKLRAEALALERNNSPLSDSDELSLASGASVDGTNNNSNNTPSDSSKQKRKNLRKKKKAAKMEVKNHVFTAESIPDIFEEGSSIVRMITVFFSFGFRLMFVSIPFAFYTAGPIALLIVAGSLFVFFPFYDFVHHKGQSS